MADKSVAIEMTLSPGQQGVWQSPDIVGELKIVKFGFCSLKGSSAVKLIVKNVATRLLSGNFAEVEINKSTSMSGDKVKVQYINNGAENDPIMFWFEGRVING